MSENQAAGPFHAAFTYTDPVLSDFEALYRQKKEISPAMRVALGVLGAAGALYFGYMLYREGLQLTWVGYVVISSMLLLLALSGGGRRPDDSTGKYRKYYLDKGATFDIDDSGVRMQLEGQRNHAQSKFKEIYGLFDTDLCLYFVIRGRAYYILPRSALAEPAALMQYMERKCGKRFQHYDVKAP